MPRAAARREMRALSCFTLAEAMSAAVGRGSAPESAEGAAAGAGARAGAGAGAGAGAEVAGDRAGPVLRPGTPPAVASVFGGRSGGATAAVDREGPAELVGPPKGLPAAVLGVLRAVVARSCRPANGFDPETGCSGVASADATAGAPKGFRLLTEDALVAPAAAVEAKGFPGDTNGFPMLPLPAATGVAIVAGAPPDATFPGPNIDVCLGREP
jgi:hypothetical protein